MTLLRQVPEMTGFRGLVYCRHYISLQTCRFVAKPLGRLSRRAAGLATRLTRLLSGCHKVIIEDVARLDTRRDAVRDCTWNNFTTVGEQPLSAQLVTCQQLNTTAMSRYIAAVICAIPFSLGEKEYFLYYLWKHIHEKWNEYFRFYISNIYSLFKHVQYWRKMHMNDTVVYKSAKYLLTNDQK